MAEHIKDGCESCECSGCCEMSVNKEGFFVQSILDEMPTPARRPEPGPSIADWRKEKR